MYVFSPSLSPSLSLSLSHAHTHTHASPRLETPEAGRKINTVYIKAFERDFSLITMRFEYWLRRFEAEIFFCFFFCLSYTSIVNLPEIFMITKKI
jgi:hypothetical protein